MSETVIRGRKETQKIAARLVRKLTVSGLANNGAIVVALEGNLGSGKTTFVQGFARAFGIKENVLSPTFVLMKIYKVGRKPKVNLRPGPKSRESQKPKRLIHIDCYRIDSPKDLLYLGFKEILEDKDAIILIEWAGRIRKLIPKNSLWINFLHGRSQYERVIKLKTQNPKIKITT
jgi:tRNA threonylcarbamoyladenosine biosynthesis protein TsaE